MLRFSEAITCCLKTKIFNWRDRAPRSEYWWFYLFMFIAQYVISLLLFIPLLGPILYVLAYLYLTWAQIMVTIRRLHDTNRSGWWGLVWLLVYICVCVLLVGIIFVTALYDYDNYESFNDISDISIAIVIPLLLMVAMTIYFIVILASKGTVGPNRFGSDPLAMERFNEAAQQQAMYGQQGMYGQQSMYSDPNPNMGGNGNFGQNFGQGYGQNFGAQGNPQQPWNGPQGGPQQWQGPQGGSQQQPWGQPQGGQPWGNPQQGQQPWQSPQGGPQPWPDEPHGNPEQWQQWQEWQQQHQQPQEPYVQWGAPPTGQQPQGDAGFAGPQGDAGFAGPQGDYGFDANSPYQAPVTPPQIGAAPQQQQQQQQAQNTNLSPYMPPKSTQTPPAPPTEDNSLYMPPQRPQSNDHNDESK